MTGRHSDNSDNSAHAMSPARATYLNTRISGILKETSDERSPSIRLDDYRTGLISSMWKVIQPPTRGRKSSENAGNYSGGVRRPLVHLTLIYDQRREHILDLTRVEHKKLKREHA